jgi:hypothetical protein
MVGTVVVGVAVGAVAVAATLTMMKIQTNRIGLKTATMA